MHFITLTIEISAVVAEIYLTGMNATNLAVGIYGARTGVAVAITRAVVLTPRLSATFTTPSVGVATSVSLSSADQRVNRNRIAVYRRLLRHAQQEVRVT